VLERANLLAVELRDEDVAAEHSVLALLETPAGSRSHALLSEAGADPAELRLRVLALTDHYAPDSAASATAPTVSAQADAAEVARLLGISRRRVAELASAADFPASELDAGGHRVWPRRAVEAWAVGHRDRGASD